MVEGAETSSTSASASRMTSSFVKVGDRTRFTVELRPDETTIVSWKKLVKDAAKAEGTVVASSSVEPVAASVAPQPPLNSVPATIESRLAPVFLLDLDFVFLFGGLDFAMLSNVRICMFNCLRYIVELDD
jgi:hypothetical protein